MFGCVGNDDFGKTLLENFRKENVCIDYIGMKNEVATGTAFITVGENDNTIIIVAGANDCVTCEYVDSIKEELLKCDIVLLQHEIPQETINHVVNICHDNNIKVLLNPAPARKVSADILEKLDYLTPNEHEAAIIFENEASIEDVLARYPEKLIITQGSKGIAAKNEKTESLLISARKSKVVDTTGAGDTFNGAFAHQIASGVEFENALHFANIAAGLSVEKNGAQDGMPTIEQVENELKKKS